MNARNVLMKNQIVEIQIKSCNKCKSTKPLSEFCRHKKSKDGYNWSCKKCKAKDDATYYRKNRPKIIKRVSVYTELNKNKIKEYLKNYNKINRVTLQERQTERERNRYQNDPAFRLITNQRGRIKKFLKGTSKSVKSMEIIGCTREFLLMYLENQFYPDPKTGETMNWDNYRHDKWHVDHIIPLNKAKDFARENKTNEETELIKLFHYTNLQPLWAWQNLEKSDK
jgi:hypothetical protein